MYIYTSVVLNAWHHFAPWPLSMELSPGPGRASGHKHTHCPAIPEHTLCMPNRPSENSIERVVHGSEKWRGKQRSSVLHAPACSCTLRCFDGVNECLKANSQLPAWAPCTSVHAVPVRALTPIYYCSDFQLVITFPFLPLSVGCCFTEK